MNNARLLLLVTSSFLILACAGTPLAGLGGFGGTGTGGAAGGCEPSMFIRVGLTQQQDVVARCGQPTSKQSNTQGSTWIYDPDATVSGGDVMRDSCEGLTGIPYNVCILNVPKQISMTVQFDANGIVTDYNATQSARPARRPSTQPANR